MRTAATAMRVTGLAVVTLLASGCAGGKGNTSPDDSASCPYEGYYASLEEFGAAVIPIECANYTRCHRLTSATYEECVDAFTESKYVYESKLGDTGCDEWDPAWSCTAAQCIKEWGAQEDYYEVTEPDCENEPNPWRPEVCGELYKLMSCSWTYGM